MHLPGNFVGRYQGSAMGLNISKRQGVFLTDKSPRTYQIRFTGKRWIDLNSHMTGTQPILAAAASFYPHDYAYDDCLVRKVNV